MSVDRRIVVVALLAAVVARFATATRQGADAGSDRQQVVAAGQRLLDEIRTAMIDARMIARGDGRWLQRLDLGPAPALADARLPRATAERDFGREAVAGARTGNAVLFASPAHRVAVRHTAASRVQRVQLYRLVAFYLTRRPGGSVGEVASEAASEVASEAASEATGASASQPVGTLDLARFVSVPVVDLAAIDALPDAPTRQRVLRSLASGGGERVAGFGIRRSGAAAGVYRIDAAAGALRPVPVLPAAPEHCQAGLLAGTTHAVAGNDAGPGAGIGGFSRVSDSGSGFPHGFEVQLSRPAARQVLVHLTLVHCGNAAPVYADQRGIALVREI